MNHNIRFYLIASLLGMTVMVGGISLFFGTYLINKTVTREAKNKIQFDLNAALEIYSNVEKQINSGLSLTARDQGWEDCINDKDTYKMEQKLANLIQILDLDFSGFVKNNYTTLCRQSGNKPENPDTMINPVALLALETKSPISGTFVLSHDEIKAEDPKLAESIKITVVNTPEEESKELSEVTSCMVIASAVPIYENNLFLGVIYGGVILNHSIKIVDKVRKTVFQNEQYQGENIGTVTIFLKDLRISTNVLTKAGNRAVGTKISKEVGIKVLTEGESWIDRAFVVNNWNITAYKPIKDYHGDIAGILSVGVNESKYAEFKRNTLLVFIAITVAGIIIAVLLGYILSKLVLNPVYELIKISKKVSEGDLYPVIGKISKGEMGNLQKTFIEMVVSLREQNIHQKEESEKRLIISQKQASVGRLAAGVAHEINNPLTGVLTFTHMLLQRDDLDSEMKSDLETIAKATDRVKEIVKGLLNFSRQIKLKPELSNINKIIEETITLIENQALVKRVFLCFDPGSDIQKRTLDRSQFQSVIMNIIINAIDATNPGGNITISTRCNLKTQNGKHREIEIIIADNGCGISPDQLDKMFDPFFTTKEVGKGTGLGLSVSLGIIEHHGGTISVKSQIGKGSTFVIHLPLDKQNE